MARPGGEQADTSVVERSLGAYADEGRGATPEQTCDGRIVTARLEAFRRLALDSALADIARLFQRCGVRPLLIKGPAFARWLYDDPRERSYNDIDLLLAPNEFAAAKRGLAELNFTSLAPEGWHPNEHADAYHEEWIRPGTLPVAVELHHTLWGVPAAPSLVWQRLTENVQAIEVAGTPVNVPSEAVSALIVGLHAADHGSARRSPAGWSHLRRLGLGESVRLDVGGRYAQRDLQLALERADMQTWRAAAALAEELGAGPLFAFGLRLDSAGRDVADQLGLTDGVPRQLRLRASAPTATAQGIERLITTRGLGARLRLLGHQLVPSRAFMLASSPLARRGRWGLTCAYLWRPVRLMMKLPRGVQAWSRAAAPAQPETGARTAITTSDSPSGGALPDFVVAGAQKASSNMLHAVLREHPGVEMPARERVDFADPNYSSGSAEAMRSRFTDENAVRRGFKAASYLGQPEVAPRLAADLHTPDVVFVLRDPVKRAISAWFWYMKLGRVPVRPVDVAFRRLLGSDLTGPERENERQILEWGLYARHLEHWLTYFPREKIHVVLDIDLRRDPDRTIRGLYEALGLDPGFTPTAHRRRYNPGIYSYPRVRWLRLRLRCVPPGEDGVRRPHRPERRLPALADSLILRGDRHVLSRLDRSGPPVLGAEIEHALRSYYRADILRLRELLGVELSPWLAPSR